jgi:CheY-like chemotaxis protein
METTRGRITVSLKGIGLADGAEPELALPAGKYARFSVADTGCGIDPAVMDKIFEPYFTTKAQGKGTGLGLSVVSGIVKDHNGDIRVTSSPGKGTTMDLYFPVLDSELADEVNEDEPVRGQGDERIMVVDDEAQVALMESRMLERFGYRVTSFTSSPAALDAFCRSPGAFDLVVTDITMPDMTGDYLARKLISIRPDLRIIACTGFSERIDHEQISAVGIRRILTKPISRPEMIRAVRQVLDEARDIWA